MTEEGVVDLEVGRFALRTFLYSPRLGPVSTWITRDTWAGGVCKAQCYMSRGGDWVLRNGHRSPDAACMCGIYGASSLDALRWQYPGLTRNLVTVMAAEGKTIVGNLGLRTEFARIVAYWSPEQEILVSCRSKFPGAQSYRSYVHLNEMLDEYRLPMKHSAPLLLAGALSVRPCLVRALTAPELLT